MEATNLIRARAAAKILQLCSGIFSAQFGPLIKINRKRGLSLRIVFWAPLKGQLHAIQQGQKARLSYKEATDPWPFPFSGPQFPHLQNEREGVRWPLFNDGLILWAQHKMRRAHFEGVMHARLLLPAPGLPGGVDSDLHQQGPPGTYERMENTPQSPRGGSGGHQAVRPWQVPGSPRVTNSIESQPSAIKPRHVRHAG